MEEDKSGKVEAIPVLGFDVLGGCFVLLNPPSESSSSSAPLKGVLSLLEERHLCIIDGDIREVHLGKSV